MKIVSASTITPRSAVIMTGKLVASRAGDTLLYDLGNDPYETTNVFSTAATPLINSLNIAYNVWSETLVEPIWPSMINYNFKDEDGKVYSFDN